MNTLCKGTTISGNKCKRRATEGDYCFQHKSFHQEKPSECIICCESLANQKRALKCGHWIHLQCIVNSAKAECPICRVQLKLGPIATARIEQLAAQRKAELVQEEEAELFQNTFVPAIVPILEEFIGQFFVESFEETNSEDEIYDILYRFLDYDIYIQYIGSDSESSQN